VIDEILRNPDDDGPRLVYADWLLERGDPRGELIRLQCETSGGWRDRRARRRRVEELLADLGRRWANLEGLGHSARFERGFVVHATVGVATLIARAEELFARAPLLGSVKLEGLWLEATGELGDTSEQRDIAESLAGLGALPALARLRALELDVGITISTLDLGLYEDEFLDADAAAVLASSPHGMDLRSLSFRSGTDGVVDALDGALPHLERFEARTGLSSDGVTRLAARPALRALRWDSWSGLTLAGVDLSRLRELAVGTDARATDALFESTVLEKLHVQYGFDRPALEQLAEPAVLPALRVLGVRSSEMTPQLARRFEGRRLEVLDLRGSSRCRGLSDELSQALDTDVLTDD
jgi:uncharacterized protein (TIGR02996 family)